MVEIETKKTRAKQKFSRQERRNRTMELVKNPKDFQIERQRFFKTVRNFDQWFTDNGYDSTVWETAVMIYISLGLIPVR